MAEAKITLTLNPTEYDVVRHAVADYQDAQHARHADASLTPQQRRDASAQATVAGVMLPRIGGRP